MDRIPGRIEALCRAHTMRCLRDEGASVELIARFFGYQPHNIVLLILWHERLYPVMPDFDEVGAPHLLDRFRKFHPP
ncbi:hypothetical protein GN109_05925 [Collimonas pratensis]|uniref:hypothetical protein n=1 Tax=Collimonas pratensis TaxID=279113 RepID=UPI00143D7F5A|nr:hypothetical protein [Collimonas pratensis]NKI68951.1 hypothetical protein [Collimonas pratensis]